MSPYGCVRVTACVGTVPNLNIYAYERLALKTKTKTTTTGCVCLCGPLERINSFAISGFGLAQPSLSEFKVCAEGISV